MTGNAGIIGADVDLSCIGDMLRLSQEHAVVELAQVASQVSLGAPGSSPAPRPRWSVVLPGASHACWNASNVLIENSKKGTYTNYKSGESTRAV